MESGSHSAADKAEAEMRAFQDAVVAAALGFNVRGLAGSSDIPGQHAWTIARGGPDGSTACETFAAHRRQMRRALAICLRATTGLRVRELAAFLGHSSGEVTAAYADRADDKARFARDQKGQHRQRALNAQLREWLSPGLFDGDNADDVHNPYLEPISAAAKSPEAPTLPILRLYTDMDRVDALAAHLSGLDAQLGKDGA